MIDIFYYIGIIYILMQTRVFFKTDKSMKEMNDTLDYLDKAKVSARNGEGVNRKEVLDRYNKKFNIKAFIGICTLIWNVVGILFTEQKLLFGLLMLLTLSFVHIVSRAPFNKRWAVCCMDSLVHILIVLLILNHHFKVL